MPDRASSTWSQVIQTDSAELHVEQSPAGRQPLLLIPGGGGDAGLFDSILDPLCERFSLTTYDRRSNSRSPRPAGWETTSIEEQADDAASLIRALQLDPVCVFGTSWSALIALDLAVRHPGLVRIVLIHEAPLFAVLPDRAEAAEDRRALTAPAIAAGDYGAAFATLIESNNGHVLETIDRTLRARVLGNGEVMFRVELPGFGTYLPSAETVASLAPRLIVAAGRLTRATRIHAATSWIATQSGAPLVELPGGHAPYLEAKETAGNSARHCRGS